MLKRSIFREIKRTLGRYIAILAIVALGVGFFSGLKVSKEAMLSTGDDYLKSVSLFDFQGVSTLGFTEDSVEEIKAQPYVTEAEGSITFDVLFDLADSKALVFKTMSLPQHINLPVLSEGRMPEKSDECVLDDMWLGTGASIGSKITLSSENDQDTEDLLSHKEYTIVGTVSSPLYMNYERGTTSKGSGTVSGFIYLGDGGFDIDYYTGIYTTVGEYEEIYSDAYKEKIDTYEKDMEQAFNDVSQERYDELFQEYEEEYNKEIADKRAEVIQEALNAAGDLSAYGPMADTIKENIEKEAGEAFDKEVGEMPEPPFEEPKVYSLDRETNVGYVCFDNDTSIINSIAKVFPVFFFLVAALVCITSMTRMVDEQRTQIGVLKAMGYSTGAILNTYMFYSGSASIIGGLFGFFAGSYLFPYVIWRAYTMMYDFSDSVNFVINWKLGIITIAAAILCTMGATLFSCLSDSKEVPAELIRPKSPNPGKRIFLERIPFIWNKISFLYKVSLRNIFRYKKRFLMMIVGISGCTALLLTGFGIKDSISHIAELQYSEISLYDYSVVFDDELTDESRTNFISEAKKNGNAEDIVFCEQLSMNYYGSAGNPLRLISISFDNLDKFLDIHYRGESLPPPSKGEIIICESFALRHNLKIGDKIKLQDDDLNTADFTVSGICENYIYNYGYVTPETFTEAMGRSPKDNTAFVVSTIPDVDEEGYTSEQNREEILNQAAAKVREVDNVASVALADEFKYRIATMMKSLNAIVYVVVASAGALAFIVIYNLTNINITERIREIATIKVLGFNSKETAQYVFRENLFLTGISALVGLLLGKALHAFVINEIKVDMIFFPIRVMPISYVLSFVLTFVFAIVVMLALYFKLKSISMTESLKSVE
ncbi:MAG: ABC transporter permease [Firmicutes bacterium]|nr:ABC transporter permease [Bacillota bacterium]